MPDALYHELSALITTCLPALPVWVTTRLAWYVVSILLADTIVTSRIASKRHTRCGGSVRVESHERRVRRILNDARLTQAAVYAPVVRHVIQWSAGTTVYILIDETSHTDWVRVLTAALWYRGRAIPLAWVQWKAQQAFTTDQHYWTYTSHLLDQVAAIVPPEVPVVILADRAFGCPVFLDQVTAHGWHWLVRVQGQTRLRQDAQPDQAVRDLVTRQHPRWRGAGMIFKKQGWRSARVAAWWDTRHTEPLLVASSLAADADLVRLYRKRAAIECLFRDWKTAGWHWEQSQVRDLDHSERILVGLAWATLVTLCQGEQVAQEYLAQPASPRRWPARIGKRSVFTLGRERLDARLAGTLSTPGQWQLRELTAPTWSDQVCLQQAQARRTMAAA